jgi:hypothetical protein
MRCIISTYLYMEYSKKLMIKNKKICKKNLANKKLLDLD